MCMFVIGALEIYMWSCGSHQRASRNPRTAAGYTTRTPPDCVVYCGQTAVCIRIPLGTEIGLSLGNIVLGGDPAPPPLKGPNPQFSAKVHCGWTNMPLGMEVGLSPGDFVFDWDLAPCRKKALPPPNFWPMSIVAKQLGATWYGGKPRPRRRCVRWGRSSPPPKRNTAPQFSVHVYHGHTAGWMKTPLDMEVDLSPGHTVRRRHSSPVKGAQQPPSIRPMSIVATFAHLSYCWALVTLYCANMTARHSISWADLTTWRAK